MAMKLSEEELVSFKELLMANEIYFETLVLLLIEKGRRVVTFKCSGNRCGAARDR